MKTKDLKIESNYILKFMFFLLFLFTCFQNLILIDLGGFSFKYSHLVSILFLPLLFKKKIIELPINILNIFMIYIILLSIIVIPFNGFNSLLLNYIFSYYYLIIIGTVGKTIDYEDWIKIIKYVSLIVIVATYIKIIMNINLFIIFFKNPMNHPMIYTFFGGGVNLESTWIGLLGFFFIGDKKGFAYGISSFVISVLYASRCGMVVSVLLLSFLIFQKREEDNAKSKCRMLITFIICLIFLIYLLSHGYLDYIIKRFLVSGEDNGSQGRMKMWQFVIPSFLENPFGCGLGNGVNQIEKLFNVYFLENNLHNLLLQMLVETGFLGCVLYIHMIFKFIRVEYRNFFNNPCVAFICSYLILSLFQFRGGDAILFFVIGIYLNTMKEKMPKLRS